MKKTETNLLLVRSSQPPTVEIDAAASALYIRFKRSQVARTIRHPGKWPLVMVDVDTDGDVIGVECVGVSKFVLQDLLKKAAVRAPAVAIAHARFLIAAKPQPAAA